MRLDADPTFVPCLVEDGSLQIVAIDDVCHPRLVSMARTYQPVE